ncbi:5-oxoprolinase subunit PxpB (plasmid) [Rhizobium sp. 32-5/1]|nr:5-oxoprolinase subunit PxpB [Rhizobium sp. 32-5/1]WEZ86078.1 5-oxoprolinase subunit PxpB [Rhizobium sp. 32-5/1]
MSARDKTVESAPPIRIAHAGSGALLLDAAGSSFSDQIQEHIWAFSREISKEACVTEVVPGMNNVLVIYDPLHPTAGTVRDILLHNWANATPGSVSGRAFEIPVHYGGESGEDLAAIAAFCGLSSEEVVRRHTQATYRVAAIGAMPGFPYLSGLDPAIAMPRRDSPRARVSAGAVIIGGSQTGVMPTTAPSGWHIIGQTEIKLFDPDRVEPALLAPGDIIQFTVAGIEE